MHVRLVHHPQTLSSGPESGLCNQIFALIGYVIQAYRAHADLVMPNFTSAASGGYDVPFDQLFDPGAFARSLRRLNITTWREPPSGVSPEGFNFTVERPYYLVGWQTMKTMAHHDVNVSVFEDAVLFGLRPSAAIMHRVEIARRKYLGDEPYGCMHARIETDMAKSWVMNRAGKPPRLNPMLAAMGNESKITSLSRILVAVGSAITAEDNATLNRPTAWNATMVQIKSGKLGIVHHRPNHKNRTSSISVIHAALVDFQLCRQAEWIVGWPGSTFARTLAYYHTHERGAYFLSCGNGTMWHETSLDGWRDHQACLHPRRQASNTTTSGGQTKFYRGRAYIYDFRSLDIELERIANASANSMPLNVGA